MRNPEIKQFEKKEKNFWQKALAKLQPFIEEKIDVTKAEKIFVSEWNNGTSIYFTINNKRRIWTIEGGSEMFTIWVRGDGLKNQAIFLNEKLSLEDCLELLIEINAARDSQPYDQDAEGLYSDIKF